MEAQKLERADCIARALSAGAEVIEQRLESPPQPSNWADLELCAIYLRGRAAAAERGATDRSLPSAA